MERKYMVMLVSVMLWFIARPSWGQDVSYLLPPGARSVVVRVNPQTGVAMALDRYGRWIALTPVIVTPPAPVAQVTEQVEVVRRETRIYYSRERRVWYATPPPSGPYDTAPSMVAPSPDYYGDGDANQ